VSFTSFNLFEFFELNELFTVLSLAAILFLFFYQGEYIRLKHENEAESYGESAPLLGGFEFGFGMFVMFVCLLL
jgi:hypothetical protein